MVADGTPKHIQELGSSLADYDERLRLAKGTLIITARRLNIKGAAESDWRAAVERLLECLLVAHALSREL